MIIGLSGKKQSGKNTVARLIQALSWFNNCNSDANYRYGNEILTDKNQCLKWLENQDEIPNKWSEHSFAFKLRMCLYVITGKDEIFNGDDESKNKSSGILNNEGRELTNRELLQIFGTEVGRSISKNIWVNALINDYKKEVSSGLPINWLITDVRFPNEVEAIKNNGGIVIRINRNTDRVDNHLSESALDNYKDFNAVINNNGTLEELLETIDKTLINLNIK